MSIERQSVLFGDLLSEPVRNGIYKTKEFHGRGVKIVNMGELFSHPRLRAAVPMKRVELSDSEMDRFGLRKNDLLFARRSLVAAGAGKCSLVLDIDEPTTFESSIIRARPDNSLADSSFLYYFFNSPVGFHHLDTIRRQVAVAGITGSDLSRLEIILPPISEQRTIAQILGTLDDKIELNRRMNETLEAMARALFKDWFVDFGPTRAKMEGRDTGLPKALADLFPTSLDASAEYPLGWERGKLSDIAEHRKESEAPFDYPDAEFRHFSIPAFDEGRWPTMELGREIKSQKTRVHPDSILLSKLNPEISRVWLVDSSTEDRAVCSTEFLVFTARPPYGRAFAYCAMCSQGFRQNLESLVTGTSRSHQRAQVASVLEIALAKPPGAVAQAFERMADPLLYRAQECRRESRVLADLRDTLLPELISGELRVNGAERIAAGVA